MRKALLVVALVPLLTSAFAAAAPSLSVPKLAITSRVPVQVRGTGFRPTESVTIVLTARGTSWRKQVRANVVGRLAATFASPTLDRCTSFVLKARGKLGSRASVRAETRADCPELDYP